MASRRCCLELDEYVGNLPGLYMLECEFTSLENTRAFQLPGWAAAASEMNYAETFKNRHLALHGLD